MTIRNRIKELRNVLASSLKPNPKNWRTHPQSQSQAMRGILDEIGYADSLIARELPDGSLMLIDGHLRAETTPDEMVPVQIVDLTEAEADKLLLSLDPLAAMAESNAAAMQQLCDDAETNNAALQAMWDEMQANVEHQPVEIVEDEIPEPPADPITKAGDLWILGDHRLLCGDSTKAEDVAPLMAGAKADMVFADPPYNISFGGTMSSTSKDGQLLPYVTENAKHDAIHNDKKSPKDFQDFIRSVISIIRLHCSGAYYISFGSGNFHELLTPVASSIGYKSIIIWVKNQSPMGGGAYRRRYEPIIYGNFSGDFYGNPYSEDDVWEFDRTKKNDLHPTMKPVELVANAISHGSKLGGSVLDLFLGSGTTLIAAEQLGRKCYGMEISPAYCDVIVKRWETLTGKKATLEITNGKTRPAKTTDSAATTAGKSRQAKDKQTRAKA